MTKKMTGRAVQMRPGTALLVPRRQDAWGHPPVWPIVMGTVEYDSSQLGDATRSTDPHGMGS